MEDLLSAFNALEYGNTIKNIKGLDAGEDKRFTSEEIQL